MPLCSSSRLVTVQIQIPARTSRQVFELFQRDIRNSQVKVTDRQLPMGVGHRLVVPRYLDYNVGVFSSNGRNDF